MCRSLGEKVQLARTGVHSRCTHQTMGDTGDRTACKTTPTDALITSQTAKKKNAQREDLAPIETSGGRGKGEDKKKNLQVKGGFRGISVNDSMTATLAFGSINLKRERVCMCVQMHTCAHIRCMGVSGGTLLPPCLEQGSPAVPGCLCQASCLTSLGRSMVSISHVLTTGTQDYRHMLPHLAVCGLWGFKVGSSCLHSKHFTLGAMFPALHLVSSRV